MNRDEQIQFEQFSKLLNEFFIQIQNNAVSEQAASEQEANNFLNEIQNNPDFKQQIKQFSESLSGIQNNAVLEEEVNNLRLKMLNDIVKKAIIAIEPHRYIYITLLAMRFGYSTISQIAEFEQESIEQLAVHAYLLLFTCSLITAVRKQLTSLVVQLPKQITNVYNQSYLPLSRQPVDGNWKTELSKIAIFFILVFYFKESPTFEEIGIFKLPAILCYNLNSTKLMGEISQRTGSTAYHYISNIFQYTGNTSYHYLQLAKERLKAYQGPANYYKRKISQSTHYYSQLAKERLKAYQNPSNYFNVGKHYEKYEMFEAAIGAYARIPKPTKDVLQSHATCQLKLAQQQLKIFNKNSDFESIKRLLSEVRKNIPIVTNKTDYYTKWNVARKKLMIFRNEGEAPKEGLQMLIDSLSTKKQQEKSVYMAALHDVIEWIKQSAEEINESTYTVNLSEAIQILQNKISLYQELSKLFMDGVENSIKTNLSLEILKLLLDGHVSLQETLGSLKFSLADCELQDETASASKDAVEQLTQLMSQSGKASKGALEMLMIEDMKLPHPISAETTWEHTKEFAQAFKVDGKWNHAFLYYRITIELIVKKHGKPRENPAALSTENEAHYSAYYRALYNCGRMLEHIAGDSKENPLEKLQILEQAQSYYNQAANAGCIACSDKPESQLFKVELAEFVKNEVLTICNKSVKKIESGLGINNASKKAERSEIYSTIGLAQTV